MLRAIRKRIALACAVVVALTPLAGCGIFEDSESLLLTSQSSALAAGVETHFRVVNGGRSFEIRHEDMNERAGAQVREIRVPVEKSRTLRVSFVQTKSATDTVASGEVELPMGEDFEYSVTVHRMPAHLPFVCFGCTGDRTFPLRGSEQESTDRIVVSYVAARVPCKGCVY